MDGSFKACEDDSFREACVTVYPRRRQGEPPVGSNRHPITVRVADLVPFLHRPQRVAAEELGICVTALKRVCRKLGIESWPPKMAGVSGVSGGGAEQGASTEEDVDNEEMSVEGSSHTVTSDSRMHDAFLGVDENLDDTSALQLDVGDNDGSAASPSGQPIPGSAQRTQKRSRSSDGIGKMISERKMRRSGEHEASFDPAVEACANSQTTEAQYMFSAATVLHQDPTELLGLVMGDGKLPTSTFEPFHVPSSPLLSLASHGDHQNDAGHVTAGPSSCRIPATASTAGDAGADQGLGVGESSWACADLVALKTTVQARRCACVITEATHPYRIVHANEAWSTMCGYKEEEVLGDTMKLVQGPATKASGALAELAEAMRLGQTGQALVINYTKHGIPFLNSVHIHPMKSHADAAEAYYLGCLEDVTFKPELQTHPLTAYVHALRKQLVHEQGSETRHFEP